MNRNILIKKFFIFFAVIILTQFSFSCRVYDKEIELLDNVVIDADDFIIETFAKEVPMIDYSDITDPTLRERFASINKLNQQFGDDIYVSREDYLKYRYRKVSILGDSISDNSSGVLHKYFRDLYQNSVGGRELMRGIEEFDEMKARDKVYDIFIFSLGNNAMKGIEVDVLQHVYDGLEGRPMIIPTIVMPYVGQERNRNRDLLEFIESHENCYLADWNAIARKSDKFILEDGVHPTGAGSEAYAQLLFKTVVDVCKKLEK